MYASAPRVDMYIHACVLPRVSTVHWRRGVLASRSAVHDPASSVQMLTCSRAAGGCAGGSMAVFQLDDACTESVSASEGEEDMAAMLADALEKMDGLIGDYQ